MKFVSALLFASLTTTLFAGSSYLGGGNTPSGGNNDLISYYNDGVYDTISQIKKEIEEGVNKDELKGLTGKIAIITPLQNVSSVNLIFYKTTAAKINLFNAMTVIDENGIPYLLWDLKQRDVDAQYIIQKLTERNIPASSKIVDNDSKYFREPVLIKDLIDKITHNIKNVDTKVVVSEKKIYVNDNTAKEFPPLDVAEKTIYKDNTPKLKENPVNITKEPKYNEITFKVNTRNLSKNLKIVKNGAIFYKLSKVQRGTKLGEFTVSNLRIEEANNHNRYYISYVEDDSSQEYLLYSVKKDDTSSESIKEVNISKKEETKEIKTSKKNASTYKCDFKNIRMAQTKDGKTIKIESDSLFYNKVIIVEAVKKIGNNFLLTNSMGLPEILLNERYLTNSSYCTKVE